MERFLKSGVGNGKSSILGSPKNGGGGSFHIREEYWPDSSAFVS